MQGLLLRRGEIKMSWKMYKIKCSIVSPIHIGKRRYTYLQETYPYVPARVITGAIIARYARDVLEGKNEDYKIADDFIKENMRFSYFIPCCEEQEIKEKCENLMDHLQNTYIQSVMHTPIASGKRTAQDGALHEIEYITPYVQEEKKVFLWGYVFIKDTEEMNDFSLLEYLNKITIGGERGNGWGRIQCIDIPKKMETFFNNAKVIINEKSPIIEYGGDNHAISYAHVLAKGNIHLKNGIVEPVIGRDKGKITKARICYTPFQSIKTNMKFKIMKDGVWEGINNER